MTALFYTWDMEEGRKEFFTYGEMCAHWEKIKHCPYARYGKIEPSISAFAAKTAAAMERWQS